MNEVKAWKETVTIPTYGTGQPEKLPMFFEKRVYQGSSGAVYPHPIIEGIEDVREDRKWTALYLENRYIRVMILPELGGRIQMAYDKIKERHFIYYNRVIKPALVGLTGPWISGGIEFNWPQHHRPSTFQPVDHRIAEYGDGSKTVWLSEQERMTRTKGMAGITLYPGRAYIEVRVHLYNPTPLPRTFLWWANPAVKVNDQYQSVFPPDVHAVYDHGKRDVSTFPVATGTYYKHDYSRGVDISWYKNIPVPTSFMAVRSRYDFIGGYEHDTGGGLLHVADHHISPGKKQWTWGCGDFGRAWDRNLTDEDGPYIELMCGVYTDNQPDFSWLEPYEEKSFRQYFMPYSDVGMVKNATADAVVNMEKNENELIIKAYATSEFKGIDVRVSYRDKPVLNEHTDLSPGLSYSRILSVDAQSDPQDYLLQLAGGDNRIIVEYRPEPDSGKAVPDPAKSIDAPEKIPSVEQLYLSGLHLEQYRHATVDPTRYYLEALRREPGDVRNNNALGLWYLNRGRPEVAEAYFRKAVETLTERNPNPAFGEPYYHLGLSLKFREDLSGAYEQFYKAVWNEEMKSRGYYQLALIECAWGKFEDALDKTENSLVRNSRNHASRTLKVILLRKTGRIRQATAYAEESLKLDGFNFSLIYETYLLTGDESRLDAFRRLTRDNVHTYIECALAYASAGLLEEAAGLLELYTRDRSAVYPMVYYLMGWFSLRSGDKKQALEQFRTASGMSPDYCFPERIEESLALLKAVGANGSDAKARYYLGNYWYASRQYREAVECWEASSDLDPSFGIPHRNLAVAYHNKLQKKEKALERMKTAFRLDPSPRMLMELDQLMKKLQVPREERLQLLEKHPALAAERDDLYLEMIGLLNATGNYREAYGLLMGRTFHPWEGGEGKATGHYVISQTGRARQAMDEGSFEEALQLLEAAKHYPENLGEGKLAGAQENDIDYLMGVACDALGDPGKARTFWELAAGGPSTPSFPLYYNDQQPDKIFYQGLALRKLGRENDALDHFTALAEFGRKNLSDDRELDYFAVSYPDMQIWDPDIARQKRAWCHYLIGLGETGKGDGASGKKSLEKALETDNSLTGAVIHLNVL